MYEMRNGNINQLIRQLGPLDPRIVISQLLFVSNALRSKCVVNVGLY